MGLDYIEAASSIRDEVAMHAAHTMLLASDYFVGSNAPAPTRVDCIRAYDSFIAPNTHDGWMPSRLASSSRPSVTFCAI
jgi:hypothetical protein